MLALTLSFGHQEEHPACKKISVWTEVQMFAYGPADATASKTPSSLASLKNRLVFPFWYWLTQVVLEKRPLNVCSSSSSCRAMEMNLIATNW